MNLIYDPMLAMWMPSGPEWIVVLVIAVLLFGRRLPEVGHSIGKAIVEFKRGVNGVKNEIDSEVARDRAEQDKKSLPEQQAPSQTVARGETVEEQPSANPGTGGNPGSNPNPVA